MSERIGAGMNRPFVSFRCLSHREQFNKMWSTVSDTSILQKVAGRCGRSPFAFSRCPGGQVSGQGTAAEYLSSYLFRRFTGPPSTGEF
ncbi:hypothetical protein AYI68_g6397 [Smittium mucronatum]|uniref:Uncharacterized protein n=1 Tax=Smittium mucronatum TaxID=133383 RepID=A0A1R0GRL6_9FUNG|nr:hypothetical protein AYI68_g6397 [Smittium mucronatum]